MITNTDLTIYHKGINAETKLETWTRFYYPKCWWFETKGSIVRDGYQYNNNVDIRIPYSENSDLSIDNFSVGDIILKGKGQAIQSQQDVPGSYNIISKTNNTTGSNPHVHLRGE